jgi:hypothetical protein
VELMREHFQGTLEEKVRTNGHLALPDSKTFYSGGAKGYIDAVCRLRRLS